ncbi:MAG: geranylgeranylglycerol-phosphate geranylgeranyltransferase [Candidatus Aenigmarchaeota archaeon]|nr:geranylgeranylglycerol-phosphate geranylgeranyltransferase [Candidatus Aenigmarchaeota archaeon]
MNPYLELLRPSVCVMTVLALLAGGIVAGTFSPSMAFALVLLAGFLICGSGNAINDYIDYKIDKISMPHRPIPSGRASREGAFRLFAVTGISGLAAAWFVSLPFFGIALLNYVISTAYAYKLKKITFVKNITVSWLAAASFLAAGFIPYEIALGDALLLLAGISFLAAMSREVLKDVRDAEGDKKEGVRTLAHAIGERNAKIFGFMLIYAACIFLIAPFILGTFSVYYWIGAVPAIATCIYASIQPVRKAEKMIKVATYFVLIGFLLGSVL